MLEIKDLSVRYGKQAPTIEHFNLNMKKGEIISVVGEDGFYVTGRVAETAFDKIKEGMTVTVTSWTSGMTYEATISGVSIPRKFAPTKAMCSL